MKQIRTIGILLHEEQPDITRKNFIVWGMCKVWESRGMRVNVFRGLDEAVEPDLLFPHINLTVVPTHYQKYIDSHPCVVNRRVCDISKTLFSAQLVKPEDQYEGPVIVKTNRNCGGAPEHRLSGGPALTRLEAASLWRRAWERFDTEAAAKRVSRALANAQALFSGHYPVFASVKDVPPEVFDNPELIVERFLPERDGELYCVRSYVFFGNRAYNVLKKGPNPIVKASAVVDREPAPIPDEIIEARRQLGFDYGKFDYVVHDGTPVLLDVNRTPTFAGKTLSSGQLQRAVDIAEGLAQWTTA